MQVISPTINNPTCITTCSSPISLNVVGPVSFTTAAATTAATTIQSDPSSISTISTLSPEDKKLIYQEVEDPHIGGFILEIAGYVQETRPESPYVSAFNILSKLFILST